MSRKLKKTIVLIFFTLIFAFFTYSLVKNQTNHPINKNKILTIGLESKISTFDPRIIGLDANTQYMEELLFLPLISFDKFGTLKNVLAQSIIPQSNRSWKIKIKPGFFFASGKEITAQDIVATYDVIMHPPFGFPVSPRKGAFKNVVKFEATSPHEINLEITEPDASFLNNLVIGTLPSEVAKKSLPNDVIGKLNESGPYTVKMASNTELIFVKNNYYHVTEPSKMNEIHFLIIPDAGTRYAALIKGDLDIIQNALDPDKVNTIEKNENKQFHVLETTKLGTTYLGFNFKNPVLQNLNVREAIGKALDIKSILKYRLHSDEAPATSLFPPENFYFNKNITQVSYAPDEAKLLLKKSGLKLPIPISIKVSSSNKIILEGAKAIVANLKAVGFNPQLETLENSVFQDQIRKGLSQIWISPWTGFKDPDHLHFIFASDMIPPNGGNRGFYSNSTLDTLLLHGREELNLEKRKEIYDQAQEIISRELPYIFLWHGKNFAVVSQAVSGFEIYADGRYMSLLHVTKTNTGS